MKKVLIVLAACAVSAMATSQPVQSSRDARETEHDAMVQRAIEQRDRGGSEMDRHDMERHAGSEPHRQHKVWVPAHRDEHGHHVNGHYTWS